MEAKKRLRQQATRTPLPLVSLSESKKKGVWPDQSQFGGS